MAKSSGPMAESSDLATGRATPNSGLADPGSPLAEIRPLPDDGNVAQDAFAVMREAMRGKEMVALARRHLKARARHHA